MEKAKPHIEKKDMLKSSFIGILVLFLLIFFLVIGSNYITENLNSTGFSIGIFFTLMLVIIMTLAFMGILYALVKHIANSIKESRQELNEIIKLYKDNDILEYKYHSNTILYRFIHENTLVEIIHLYLGDQSGDKIHLPNTIEGHPVASIDFMYFTMQQLYYKKTLVLPKSVDNLSNPFAFFNYEIDKDNPFIFVEDLIVYDSVKKTVLYVPHTDLNTLPKIKNHYNVSKSAFRSKDLYDKYISYINGDRFAFSKYAKNATYESLDDSSLELEYIVVQCKTSLEKPEPNNKEFLYYRGDATNLIENGYVEFYFFNDPLQFYQGIIYKHERFNEKYLPLFFKKFNASMLSEIKGEIHRVDRKYTIYEGVKISIDSFNEMMKKINESKKLLIEKANLRITHCWNCGAHLDSSKNATCSNCGWLICHSCGACSSTNCQ